MWRQRPQFAPTGYTELERWAARIQSKAFRTRLLAQWALALNLRKESIVSFSTAFAQTAAGGESSLLSMLPLVLMFVVLYFVMIRPQMKRQKEAKAMIDALGKGDEVVMAGGVLGKISKLGDAYLHVEVANGVELQVQRSSVVQVLPKGTIKKD